MEGADCYNAHSSLLLFNTTRNGRSTAEARAPSTAFFANAQSWPGRRPTVDGIVLL